MSQQHRSFDPIDAHQVDLTTVFPGIYDGVIASNDVQALEIGNIYRRAGMQLNQDYFLIGYNGSRLIRQTNPELPTVIQPIEELSAKLIDTLMTRIKSPRQRCRQWWFQSTFTLRKINKTKEIAKGSQCSLNATLGSLLICGKFTPFLIGYLLCINRWSNSVSSEVATAFDDLIS